ncbi:PREDICTED: uncharacterized protein LOC105569152 [Vollenhovia emeryi]|uniref:uncharacterized protein LOC105569152 n=1 Tax=Vollenhovia emeryi TaxID=411798 RepID=UPI0005F3816A|nr:PREDICTED: uncharacterized protein LOC105569152 [Vollenhovia emeryi]
MFSLTIQKCKMQRKWRLFNATDFQSLMYPCFTFCRIVGVFPYKISASTFEISKPYYILSTMVVCICCIANLVFIHAIMISGQITYGGIIGNIGAVFYIILTGLIVIITHILSVPRMRLLQTILEISSKLSSKSYQKLSRLIHIKDILVIMLLVAHVLIYLVKVEWKEFRRNCLHVLTLLLDIYMGLLVLQMNMLYINCVCVLMACLKKLNNDLVHMQRLTDDTKSSVPSSICLIQRNEFFLTRLKTLMKQHLMINRTVRMLNIIFSLQILAIIIMSFFEITLHSYFFVIHWQDKLLIGLDWHIFDAFLTTVLYYVIQITLIVWACETGKNQAQKITTTIYDILNNTTDEQIKAELRLFSLQILHCENTFSAKDGGQHNNIHVNLGTIFDHDTILQ